MLSGGEGLIAVMTNPRRNAKGRFVKSGGKKHHKARRRTKHHTKSRRRSRSRAVTVAVSSNPHRRRSRRVHHNPRFSFGLGGLKADLIGASIGAGGALGVDLAITALGMPLAGGTVLLPSFLQTGVGRLALRGGAAFGVGWLAKLLFGSRVGQAATLGALTVIVFDVGRSALNQFVLPATMQLSESDYSDLTMAGLARQGSEPGGSAGVTDINGYLPRPGMAGYLRRPAAPMTTSAFVRDGVPRNVMEGLNADLEM
jgi:hypothetical protein